MREGGNDFKCQREGAIVAAVSVVPLAETGHSFSDESLSLSDPFLS